MKVEHDYAKEAKNESRRGGVVVNFAESRPEICLREDAHVKPSRVHRMRVGSHRSQTARHRGFLHAINSSLLVEPQGKL